MKLTFLGGAGTVTGSKYLLEAGDKSFLIDCGLFQGLKQLRLRNRAPLTFDPGKLDAVILTHAHLDHSGYLPLLIKKGFSGPVYCTQGTISLLEILLPDSGFLQEKDAEFANRYGFSKHHPALPLYTQQDAEDALNYLKPVAFEQTLSLGDGVSLRFRRAGHILGAATLTLEAQGRKVVFSGDLGRHEDPIMFDPTPVEEADFLVVESTYGDSRHEEIDPQDVLAGIIKKTARRGGVVLIPAFAVGRAQTLLYHIQKLKAAKRIPDIPVFLDSPMAIEATEVFCRHARDHKLSPEEARQACQVARYTRRVEESKELDDDSMPKVIISASGMATGGRVLHHLKRFAPDPRNTILFAGFQAAGTRGAHMVAGADAVKIHGRYVPVEAEVDNIAALSSHADADEILGWLSHFKYPPKRTFITHGEPEAADALRLRIEEELGWDCTVPDHRDVERLDG